MKKTIVILLLAVIFASCQKLIEIPLPEFQQKAVVNCLFSADTNIQLRLSQTSNLNDSVEKLITNATIILKQDNTIIDTLINNNNGFYISNIFPQKSKNYSVEVQSPDLGICTANTYIPNDLTINSISQQDFAVPLTDNQFDGDIKLPASRFSFTISDPANEKNYYEVTFGVKQFWHDDTNYVQKIKILNPLSYDNVIINEDILDYKPTTIVFSDSLFNGQTKNIDILYKLYWLSWGSDGSGHTTYYYGRYRLYYTIRSISKEMYLYRKSLIKHLYNQQTDDITTFGDPVQLWSNINGGYGVFAGFTGVRDSILVDETDFEY